MWKFDKIDVISTGQQRVRMLRRDSEPSHITRANHQHPSHVTRVPVYPSPAVNVRSLRLLTSTSKSTIRRSEARVVCRCRGHRLWDRSIMSEVTLGSRTLGFTLFLAFAAGTVFGYLAHDVERKYRKWHYERSRKRYLDAKRNLDH
ncbi:uncharacterized protein MONBRDRAFT_12652 [Monosiga brevicollis MX1]|uniref:Uncharacterized protein n=1 Tax=Monosiga brevicollis TaxID=81824 RepID=A9VCW8_MONBE|nr:uncharacterized protein MONBRDRAFT_12652 [Monosiga brevicollis MX1]EDQ84641.1 predicted protein [Monosiga brevicollis MX1]|eukprot:XP_001750545.1 hypothetical protein [Monosiga brevicollis MX1]